MDKDNSPNPEAILRNGLIELQKAEKCLVFIENNHWRIFPLPLSPQVVSTIVTAREIDSDLNHKAGYLAPRINTTKTVAEYILSAEIPFFNLSNYEAPFTQLYHTVVLMPHAHYQEEFSEFKRASGFPYSFVLEQARRGYSISFFRDDTVTKDVWLESLAAAPTVLYFQGHGLQLGSEFRLYMGNKRPNAIPNDPRLRNYEYINASFSLSGGSHLLNSLIYLFACHSFSSEDMKNALEELGAAAYVGWTPNAPASWLGADRIDSVFWRRIFQGRSVQDAIEFLQGLRQIPREIAGEMSTMRFWGGEWRLPQ